MKKIMLLLIVGFSCLTVNAQEVYVLDPAHTFLNFEVERFMVGGVKGKFNEFKGQFDYSESENQLSAVKVSIKSKSLDTDHQTRDGHLTGPVWLDADQFPEITFESREVFFKEDGKGVLRGSLTIKGVSKEVEFPFVFKGPFKDPTGFHTIGLNAEFQINRKDYGITFNKVMDNGELFIGDTVNISIRALALKK